MGEFKGASVHLALWESRIPSHKPEVSANDVLPVLASRHHMTLLTPGMIKPALYSRLLMDSILDSGPNGRCAMYYTRIKPPPEWLV